MTRVSVVCDCMSDAVLISVWILKESAWEEHCLCSGQLWERSLPDLGEQMHALWNDSIFLVISLFQGVNPHQYKMVWYLRIIIIFFYYLYYLYELKSGICYFPCYMLIFFLSFLLSGLLEKGRCSSSCQPICIINANDCNAIHIKPRYV